jgi:hypothetical protein
MTVDEVATWVEFFNANPVGPWHEEGRFASLMALTANLWCKKKYKAKDFMFKSKSVGMTQDDMKIALMNAVIGMGGKIIVKST